ncbi:hypothetical protein B0H11DRAFT_1285373 [Mycena galericulata]|nr:hypothetical protein B0H11DRAFT_1285373 [Mycena galericulata]
MGVLVWIFELLSPLDSRQQVGCLGAGPFTGQFLGIQMGLSVWIFELLSHLIHDNKWGAFEAGPFTGHFLGTQMGLSVWIMCFSSPTRACGPPTDSRKLRRGRFLQRFLGEFLYIFFDKTVCST